MLAFHGFHPGFIGVIFFSRFYNMGSRGRISTPATSAANNPDRVILTDKPMRKYAAAKSN
jgi:hypothetical protein